LKGAKDSREHHHHHGGEGLGAVTRQRTSDDSGTERMALVSLDSGSPDVTTGSPFTSGGSSSASASASASALVHSPSHSSQGVSTAASSTDALSCLPSPPSTTIDDTAKSIEVKILRSTSTPASASASASATQQQQQQLSQQADLMTCDGPMDDVERAWIEHSSKLRYVVRRILECVREAEKGDLGPNNRPLAHLRRLHWKRRKPKLLVVSQVWEQLWCAATVLAEKGIACAKFYPKAPPNERKVAIERFTSCPEVSVLLLSVELGSHGLDLSCASHVFILDPVLDYNVEKQVISRAHRVGALRTVHVEHVILRGTWEEQIMRVRDKWVEGGDDANDAEFVSRKSGGGHADKEQKKYETLLRSLRRIEPGHLL